MDAGTRARSNRSSDEAVSNATFVKPRSVGDRSSHVDGHRRLCVVLASDKTLAMRRSLIGICAIATLFWVACSESDSNSGPDAGSSGTSGGSSGTSGGSSGTSGGSSGTPDDAGGGDEDAPSGTISVTSPAFQNGGTIPAAHSCDGAGVSIPLSWSGAPASTQSYAVVMRDLTLGRDDNYHWVIWDIPASTTSLPEGIPNTANPDPPGGGAKQTYWSFGEQLGYGFMCPVEGPPTHEYELTVYAFSVATLPVDGADGPAEVHAVIQANKIASGSIKGSYTKQ